MRRALLVFGVLLSCLASAQSYERFSDQVYMHEAGAAFTCDVFKAKHPNGAAVIYLVSGGWVSDHKSINLGAAEALTARGYTCIEVVHGAQPRYKLPEIVSQVRRAVRFARSQAAKYGYQSDKIGITGGSAGGHLSLLLASTGDPGDPTAADPIDQQASTLQAVAVFFPPCDFMHWSEDGQPAFRNQFLLAAFGKAFVEDPKNTPKEKFDELAKKLSPSEYVSKAMPPTMIVHGDADALVPISQSVNFCKQLESFKVPNQLLVAKGKGHGYKGMELDFLKMIDWYDKYLLGK